MKTIDRNVRGLWKKPFAALALLGLVGFGFDALFWSPARATEQRLVSVMESAPSGGQSAAESSNISQSTEAKAKLFFKRSSSSTLYSRYWGEELDRFERLTK